MEYYHGHSSMSQSAKTFIHYACVDTACRLEYLPSVMADSKKERESVLLACFDSVDDEQLFMTSNSESALIKMIHKGMQESSWPDQ